MDPQAGASFIPKKPLGPERHSTAGLFVLLSIFLFVLSLVAAAGVFGYEKFLTNSIANKDASLKHAESAFELDTIQTLERTDSRLTHAHELLVKHIAPSGLFDLLAGVALENVQFTNFSYLANADGTVSITLAGVGDSFSTVALQSDQFGANKYLRDVVFSGVAVDNKGNVSFSVAAKVDPSITSYIKRLASDSATPNPATGTGSSTPQ
jgi:hypothetical protein